MAPRQSLLESALASPPVKGSERPTEQQLELAEAWLAGTITLKQVANALGNRGKAGCYIFLARSARELWRRHR